MLDTFSNFFCPPSKPEEGSTFEIKHTLETVAKVHSNEHNFKFDIAAQLANNVLSVAIKSLEGCDSKSVEINSLITRLYLIKDFGSCCEINFRYSYDLLRNKNFLKEGWLENKIKSFKLISFVLNSTIKDISKKILDGYVLDCDISNFKDKINKLIDVQIKFLNRRKYNKNLPMFHPDKTNEWKNICKQEKNIDDQLNAAFKRADFVISRLNLLKSYRVYTTYDFNRQKLAVKSGFLSKSAVNISYDEKPEYKTYNTQPSMSSTWLEQNRTMQELISQYPQKEMVDIANAFINSRNIDERSQLMNVFTQKARRIVNDPTKALEKSHQH